MKYLIIPIFLFLVGCGEKPLPELKISVEASVDGQIDVFTEKDWFTMECPQGVTEKTVDADRLEFWPKFISLSDFVLTVTHGSDTLLHGAQVVMIAKI